MIVQLILAIRKGKREVIQTCSPDDENSVTETEEKSFDIKESEFLRNSPTTEKNEAEGEISKSCVVKCKPGDNATEENDTVSIGNNCNLNGEGETSENLESRNKNVETSKANINTECNPDIYLPKESKIAKMEMADTIEISTGSISLQRTNKIVDTHNFDSASSSLQVSTNVMCSRSRSLAKLERPVELKEVQEYYVKYKNFSYLHCEWKTEEELLKGDKRVGPKIRRFKQRLNQRDIFEFLEDEPFNPEYTECDRILEMSEVTDPTTGKATKNYLVKWRYFLKKITRET